MYQQMFLPGDGEVPDTCLQALPSISADTPAQQCKNFLKQYMPASDAALLTDAYLQTNVALALAARELSPWAASVPWPVFLNYVLPYAM